MENLRVQVERHIAVITISRSEVLNALNFEVLKELDQVVSRIKGDADIYCVVITGAGDKAFAAGADISEMKNLHPLAAREFSLFGNRVFREMEMLEKPVIAAINGYALGGGCELALSCDIRIASENAVFGQPEVALGITPGFGGTQRLTRLVGSAKAKEIIYSAASISVEEAARIGLVNKVVAREDLMPEAMKLARKIADNAPIAVRLSKTVINRGSECAMETAVAFETEAFAQCFGSEDQKDAMQAFMNKSKIVQFKNR